MNHPRAEKSSWGCWCQQCERIVIFIWKHSWLQQTQKWFRFKGNHRMRRTLKNKSISRGPPSKYNTSLCEAVREIRKVSVMTGIGAQTVPIQRFLLRRHFMENSAFAVLELTWRNCSVVSSTRKKTSICDAAGKKSHHAKRTGHLLNMLRLWNVFFSMQNTIRSFFQQGDVLRNFERS